MIKNKIKGFIGVACLGVIVSACGPKQVGPNYVTASDNFNKSVSIDFIQDSNESNDNVDFDLFETGHFESTFNEEVSWEISISGYTSGAVKTITGLSQNLEEANSAWSFGRSSNVYFFQADEYVKAELKIAGLDTVYTLDSMYVSGVCDWNYKRVDGIKHIVIDRFDSDAPNPISGLSATSPDLKDQDVKVTTSSVESVEGGFSLYMTGTDLNDNGWIGGRNHERLVELYSRIQTSILPIDSGIAAEDLYFNIFVHGDSRFPKTTVEIKVYELDDTTFQSREEIRNYAYGPDENTLTSTQQSISDGWIYDIPVTWDGWKLVTVPYSMFRASNDPKTGANGNRRRESWRITGIAVSGLSYPLSGGTVSTYVDFLTVTQNGRPQFKK